MFDTVSIAELKSFKYAGSAQRIGPLTGCQRAIRSWLAVVTLSILLVGVAGAAEQIVRPPCGAAPVPAYPPPTALPVFTILKGMAASRWNAPACVGWRSGKRDLLIALSASFRFDGSTDELLERLGRVSGLSGTRYWSVSDKQWRPLIIEAAALESSDSTRRRADFAATELRGGKELFSVQMDSRLGEGVYRMRVREATADRVVIESENHSDLRAMLLPVFKPGDLKTVYFMERGSAGTWRYYALVSANSRFATGNEASFVNRAVALFRHLAGVPGDAGPPAIP
jgi:hypothetical protein